MSSIDLSAQAASANDGGDCSPLTRRQWMLRNLLVMLPFLLLYYAQEIHHQPWRDELNAWGIACASSTFSALLANVHYEAHPALWYILLWLGSRVTHAAWMMAFIQAIVSTGIYLLLAFATELRISEKLLIYLSYFIAFEYTVLSRMYGLMVLFSLAYLYTRTRHPDKVVRNTVWLGLIANVDTTGVILAGGLALEYLIHCWTNLRKTGVPRIAQIVRGAVVFVGLVAVSVATLRPAKDISWRTTGHILTHVHEMKHLGAALVSWTVLPWIPINHDFPRFFWFVEGHSRHAVAIPFIFAALYLIFRKHRSLALMLGVITICGIAFSHLIYIGAPRHFGIVYIAFLVALGILRYQKQHVHAVAYALLSLCAVGGLCAEYGQWIHPFSSASDTARWIRQQNLQDLPLIGTPDTHIIGVPELLQRPVYLLDCQCVDTYLKFAARRDHFDPGHDVVPGVIHAMDVLHAPQAVYISNRPFSDEELQQLSAGGLQVSLLHQFWEGDIVDEYFTLYRIRAPRQPKVG